MTDPTCDNCGYEVNELSSEKLCETCQTIYQKGQDDYQDWLLNTLSQMRKTNDYHNPTLEEIEDRAI